VLGNLEHVVTWLRSPVGRVHYVEPDELGFTSRCGRWRPELLPNETHGERCPACARLASDAPRQSVFVEAKQRTAAILAAYATDPHLTVRAFAERFGTTERIVRHAIQGKRKTT
jgi:hypothetical protein